MCDYEGDSLNNLLRCKTSDYMTLSFSTHKGEKYSTGGGALIETEAVTELIYGFLWTVTTCKSIDREDITLCSVR